MRLIENTNPKQLIADEGKRLRDKNDVYVEEYVDENGNIVSAHEPYYTTVIFVPDSFTEKDMELYVEE